MGACSWAAYLRPVALPRTQTRLCRRCEAKAYPSIVGNEDARTFVRGVLQPPQARAGGREDDRVQYYSHSSGTAARPKIIHQMAVEPPRHWWCVRWLGGCSAAYLLRGVIAWSRTNWPQKRVAEFLLDIAILGRRLRSQALNSIQPS